MTVTYSDDTATFTITLPGDPPQEPECSDPDCSKVAVWEVGVELPCPHHPAPYCNPHKENLEQLLGQLGPASRWGCRNCNAYVGRIVTIERIKR